MLGRKKITIKPVTKKTAPPPPTMLAPTGLSSLSSFPLCDLRAEKGMLTESSCNSEIIKMISNLIEVTKKIKAATVDRAAKTRHSHRINSFIKALDAVKAHSEPIKSKADALKIKGVGKGIGDRIDEFLKTGTLKELDDFEKELDPRGRAVMELCGITGIGEAKAVQLIEKHDVKGVDDLIAKYKAGLVKVAKNQLTHHIAVGIEFFHDLEQRIPWSEVDEIRQVLEMVVAEIDSALSLTVCGSYRRHRPTCGDIDVLITHPDLITDTDVDSSKRSFLPEIITELTDSGFLVGHLTERGKTKYMGVCKLTEESLGRRIDIRFVPKSSYPAAILYFTGSGEFNKLMRLKANERGFTINEYGIYEYLGGKKGPQVPVETEEDIFRVINCKYLSPKDRDF